MLLSVPFLNHPFIFFKYEVLLSNPVCITTNKCSWKPEIKNQGERVDFLDILFLLRSILTIKSCMPVCLCIHAYARLRLCTRVQLPAKAIFSHPMWVPETDLRSSERAVCGTEPLNILDIYIEQNLNP